MQVKDHLEAYEKEVNDVIEHITSNSKAFTAEELKEKSIVELNKLDSMIKETTGNYGMSVTPAVNAKTEGNVGVLLPANIK